MARANLNKSNELMTNATAYKLFLLMIFQTIAVKSNFSIMEDLTKLLSLNCGRSDKTF